MTELIPLQTEVFITEPACVRLLHGVGTNMIQHIAEFFAFVSAKLALNYLIDPFGDGVHVSTDLVVPLFGLLLVRTTLKSGGEFIYRLGQWWRWELWCQKLVGFYF